MANNSDYIHEHTRLVTTVVIVVFLLLAAGELYLYRQIQHLNRMTAEGMMQIKEDMKRVQASPTPLPTVMMKGGNVMMKGR